jgi:L-threonylcarbamoyladenylate synthase
MTTNENQSAITNNITDDIAAAVDALRNGKIILYPTDTVWGIGCDATNPEAVKRIYELKQRVDNKAMIILVDSLAMLERHVEEVPEVAYKLIDVTVRPTTIVYDKGRGLAHNLLGTDGSVGIRLTTEKFSAALCHRLRHPIVSTSANISGQPSPRFFHEIAPEIVSGVDFVATYRRNDTTPHQPSSVIKLSTSGEIKILRK